MRHGKKGVNAIFCKGNSSVVLVKAVSKFTVAGISPQRPGFNPSSFNVGFMLDKGGCDRFFSRYFGFPIQFSSAPY